MPSIRLYQITLEVERKFARLRTYPLHVNGGTPRFRELIYAGTHTFHDTYFDSHQKLLSQSGTWVRRRDGHWQAKIRQAGDYNNSQFQEVADVDQIARHIHLVTKTNRSAVENFGLMKTAEFATHREMWKADGKFKIVLDCTDFGHVVGEVELEDEVAVSSEEDARMHSTLMDVEIEEFMKQYHWAFDMTPAVGKLTAYFARRKSFG